MSGAFTYEDEEGNVIISSSPGMQGSRTPEASSRKSSIKPKKTERRTFKRPTIELFNLLAENETDDMWRERFLKMGNSKFPSKISWNPASESPGLYGEIIYKNRQITKSEPISKDYALEEIRSLVKEFITNYTNIEMSIQTDFNAEDDIKVIDKSKITPFPWIKLGAKEQSKLISDYVKDFGMENSLDKQEIETLTDKLVIYAMGKNIQPYLTLDDDGKILKISIIYLDENGKYQIKV